MKDIHKRLTKLYCDACGVSSDEKYVHYRKNLKMTLCRKHYNLVLNKGYFTDTNSRSVLDPNEIRVYDDYCEIDTYFKDGSLNKTFKFDKEFLDIVKDGKNWTCSENTIFCKKYGVYKQYIMKDKNPNNKLIYCISKDLTDLRLSNLCLLGSEEYKNKFIDNTVYHCDICGVSSLEKPVWFIKRHNKCLCLKHLTLLDKYGKTFDTNSRTVFDLNEYRLLEDYGEVDTYDQYGNVNATFKFSKCDLDIIKSCKWQMTPKVHGRKLYLVNKDKGYFHRIIMNNPGNGLEVDHINGDSLDNRRENLRVIKKEENLQNLKVPINNTSGVKGVYKSPSGYWYAEFQYKTTHIRSPYYEDKESAVYIRYNLETHFLEEKRNINNDLVIHEYLNKINLNKEILLNEDLTLIYKNINNQLELKEIIG